MNKRNATLAILLTAVAALPAWADDATGGKKAVNDELRARVPEALRSKGTITSVNTGTFPPYEIIEGSKTTGASADLTEAVGDILGIKIQHVSVTGLPAVLTGINAGRYDFAFGPIGDFPSRRQANDFIDWVQEYVVFAVPKGNPKQINSLDDTCGKRIAVQASGSAEQVIKKQSATCMANGKPPVDVKSFNDQPTSVLAVRSDRADAFFSSQAPLTYFVAQANGQLELAGVGKSNGFDDLYQGAIVTKGSELGPVLVDAIKELMKDGTYAAIMKKWGLEANMMKSPGMNLGGETLK